MTPWNPLCLPLDSDPLPFRPRQVSWLFYARICVNHIFAALLLFCMLMRSWVVYFSSIPSGRETRVATGRATRFSPELLIHTLATICCLLLCLVSVIKIIIFTHIIACLISSLIIITIVSVVEKQHSRSSSLALGSLDAWWLFCCCFVIILFCFVLLIKEMGCLFISIPGWSRVALGSPDAWWRPLRPTPQLPRAHRTTIFYWSSVSQFLTSSVASSSQLVAQNNNLLLVLHKFIFNWQK